MTMRVVTASVLSAVVLFVWGFVYWGMLAPVVSPWYTFDAETDTEVIATLKQSFPESGVYMYPWLTAEAGKVEGAQEEFAKQHAEGPIVKIFYLKQGMSSSALVTMMVSGFVHMLITSIICCILLAVAEPSCCYWARLGFVFGLGLFATVWIEGSNLVWWHYPANHIVFVGAYNLVAWLLAGLVIAAIVKKPVQAAESV